MSRGSISLVAVGSLLALATLDVGGGPALRNLAYGPLLEPTFATLAVKKLAELVLFAAFLDLAIRLGLGRGAIVAGLVLAAHPIVSANSGALAPLAAGAAFVLGGRAIAVRVSPTVADLVGGGLTVLAAIFVSPWLLALLPTVWLPRDDAPKPPPITSLLALVVPFLAAAAVAFTRGDPIAIADPVAALSDLGRFSFATIPPASLAVVGLAIALAFRGAPAFVIALLSAPIAVALVFRVDLGASFTVAVLFALTVAIAVERASTDRPWAANLAAVTVFFFALAPIRPAVGDLVRAKAAPAAAPEASP